LLASLVTHQISFPVGDLGEGFLAVEEEFGRAISGASSVILCGGLGGEIGSFLLPALAAVTKARSITTLASVGMPFGFEGRQQRDRASTALEKLYELCDAVAVIDNDRLSGGVPSTAAVGTAFQIADRTLQASLLSLQGMLSTSGPVKITRNDLAAVLGTSGVTIHFGYGHADGSNRLHEALEMALKSPLLILPGKGTAGSALKNVEALLLLLSGPSDLSFAEVQRAVSEVERIAGERCHIKVGVRAEGSLGDPLELFLTASSGGIPRSRVKKLAASEERISRQSNESVSSPPRERDQALKSAARIPLKTNMPKQTQGVLDLENYQRGRFDKSEPTIVAGEDLDIPTFLRKGIKLASHLKH
jgi:cell division protein FtsZ